MAFLAAIPAAVGSLFSGGGIGGALSAVGSIVSGVAAYSAGAYQNKVAQMNADIAEENALRAKERSAIEAQQQDAMTAAAIGEQEAIQGASGLSLTGRSQILTRKAAARLGRLDALNVQQGGELEAYGYRTDAVNQRAAGQAAKMQGTSGLLGGLIGAGSSLIGGAKSVRSPRRYTSSDPWRTSTGTNLRIVA